MPILPLMPCSFAKQIDVPPTLARRIGRIALDALRIQFQRSEDRREREAMSVALREYRDEEEAKRRAYAEKEQRWRMEAERREAEYQAKKVRWEKEALERDLSTARDYFDDHKFNRFHNQRAQELAERSLNSRLMTIDQLEEEVLSENPEIEKRSISYGDDEISVYDLKGLPFSMLTHTVDYRQVIRTESPRPVGSS